MSTSPDSAADGGSVQTTSAQTTVAATVDQCFEVVADVAQYPDWAFGIASAEVESTDAAGRPETVRYEAEGLGRKVSYTLRYDLAGAPGTVAWTLVSADLVKAIEGRYLFTPAAESDDGDGDGPRTSVDYELAIDLAVPLPGFVMRRAEDKIVDAALKRFKDRVESINA